VSRGGASPLKPAWEAKGERGHAAPILPDGDAQGVMTLDTTAPASLLIEAGAAVCWSGHRSILSAAAVSCAARTRASPLVIVRVSAPTVVSIEMKG
jgi:hypothetical protein